MSIWLMTPLKMQSYKLAESTAYAILLHCNCGSANAKAYPRKGSRGLASDTGASDACVDWPEA